MIPTLEEPREQVQYSEDDMNRVKDSIRLRLLNDFDFYASNALKIFSKKGGKIVPFIMNEAQQFIHQIVEKQLKEQGYVRIILLKPRQIGISTYWEGRLFWKIVHSQGKRVMIVTEAEDSRNNLFDMVKTFYENLPDDIKPSIKQLAEKALLFKYPEGKGGLNCRYTVKTCDSKGMVGITSHFLHISEYGKFKPSSINNVSGLVECVPSDEDSIMGTEIVYESTAEGASGCFYDKWKKHERGETDHDYIRIFIPWFWYEKYSWKINDEETQEIMDTLSENEEWLLEQIKPNGKSIPISALAWKRRKIPNLVPDIGYTKEEFFKQWYPETADEAFVFGGATLFNAQHLDRAKLECCSPVITGNFNLGNNKFESVSNGLVKIWQKPIKNVRYVIGADVAEGAIDGDYSCGDVLKLPEMIQVAHIHGQCFTPDTNIITNNGIKKIKDIIIGDKVWTHKNRFRSVKRLFKKYHSGIMLKLKFQGNYETVCVTPDHPFYSANVIVEPYMNKTYFRKDRNHHEKIALKRLTTTQSKWLPAKDIKAIALPRMKESVPIPLNITIDRKLRRKLTLKEKLELSGMCACGCGNMTSIATRTDASKGLKKGVPNAYQFGHRKSILGKRNIEINTDFASIIGYYASEGSTSYHRDRKSNKIQDRVQFAFSYKEKDTVAKDCYDKLIRLGLNAKIRLIPKVGVTLVTVYDTYFARLLISLVSTNAHKKFFGEEIMKWPLELLKALFHSHWLGDGTIDRDVKNGKSGNCMQYSITTVSPQMARQLRDIAILIGHRPNLICVKVEGNKPRYNIKWVVSNKVKYNGMQTDEFIAYKITEKEEIEYSGDIYNLEVEDDNSYSTGCYVVHNCDPDLFGLYLNCLGRYYNNALLGPEVNSMGHTVLATLQRKRYPNLFQREVTDSVGLGRKTRKAGWLTGKGTKFRIINQLDAVLRDGISGVLNTDTINEFADFIRKEDGTYGALSGSYDDRVMSYAIAIEMAYSAPGARRMLDRNNRMTNRVANRGNIGSVN